MSLEQITDVLEAQLRASYPELTRLLEYQIGVSMEDPYTWVVRDCGDLVDYYVTIEEAYEARRALIMHALMHAKAEGDYYGRKLS